MSVNPFKSMYPAGGARARLIGALWLSGAAMSGLGSRWRLAEDRSFKGPFPLAAGSTGQSVEALIAVFLVDKWPAECQ